MQKSFIFNQYLIMCYALNGILLIVERKWKESGKLVKIKSHKNTRQKYCQKCYDDIHHEQMRNAEKALRNSKT